MTMVCVMSVVLCFTLQLGFTLLVTMGRIRALVGV